MTAIVFLCWSQFVNPLRMALHDIRKGLLLAIYVFLFIYVVFIGNSSPPISLGGLGISPSAAQAVFLLIVFVVGCLIVAEGFFGQVIKLRAPDFAYLFAVPISGRAIVASRIPNIVIKSLALTALVTFFLHLLIIFGAHLPVSRTAYRWSALLIFLYLGCFTNFAFALEVNFGKQMGLAAIVLAVACVPFAYSAYILSTEGMSGFSSLPSGLPEFIRLLIHPCLLASEGVFQVIAGKSIASNIAGLCVYYLLSFALIFVREVNLCNRVFSNKEGRNGRPGVVLPTNSYSVTSFNQYKYTIPAFGSGGVALFWANMAASAKRPWQYLGGALLGGLLLGFLYRGVLTLCATQDMSQMASIIIVGLALIIVIVEIWLGTAPDFEKIALRQPLIRPLPLSGWTVVNAELAPIAIRRVILLWTSCLVVLFTPAFPDRFLCGIALGLSIPAAMTCVVAISYLVGLVFQDSRDKIQKNTQGMYVGILTYVFISAILAAAIMAVKVFNLSPVGLAMAAFAFSLVSYVGLSALGGHLYSTIREDRKGGGIFSSSKRPL